MSDALALLFKDMHLFLGIYIIIFIGILVAFLPASGRGGGEIIFLTWLLLC